MITKRLGTLILIYPLPTCFSKDIKLSEYEQRKEEKAFDCAACSIIFMSNAERAMGTTNISKSRSIAKDYNRILEIPLSVRINDDKTYIICLYCT